MKKRIQHPNVQEAKDVREPYWFVRIYEPVAQRGGAIKEVRKKHVLGASKGPDAIGKREAELRRDAILARINGLTQAPEKAHQIPQGDFILFERLAQMFKEGHLPNLGIAARNKYNCLIDKHLLPRWTGERLTSITPHAVQVWINSIRLGWCSRNSIKATLGRIFEYAAENNLYLGRNPTLKINCGRKKPARSKAILPPEVMANVLERIEPKYRLIIETALLNGMRVSEVLGLRWRVIDMNSGMFTIEERYFRGDVDLVKSLSSERRACLDDLLDQYKALYTDNARPKGDAFVFDRGDGSGLPPRDETVREALKDAAAELGVDFLGFGMHTLRRANITWRQSGGGATSIEASKMAGHARVNMTGHYTQIEDERIRETAKATRALWAPKKEVA